MKALIYMFGLALLPLCVWASDGNEGGHGGDPYSLEFFTIGKELSKEIAKPENAKLIAKFGHTHQEFSDAVKSVRVVSDEPEAVRLRGSEVDAINYHLESRILVNRARWRQSDIVTRTKLVLHEYFGIIDVERDSYSASIEFSKMSIKVAKGIEKNPALSGIANLYYGRCINVPSLNAAEICPSNDVAIATLKSCALTQAEGNCRLNSRSKCTQISLEVLPKVSSAVLGLRYCEALVLMK